MFSLDKGRDRPIDKANIYNRPQGQTDGYLYAICKLKKNPMSISDEVVSCTCVMFSRESFNTKRGDNFVLINHHFPIGFIFISQRRETPKKVCLLLSGGLSVIITRICRRGTKDLCSVENGPNPLLEVRKTTLILYFFADLHNHPKTLQ